MPCIHARPALDHIPTELVERIADGVDSSDLSSLRATASSLGEKVWHTFARKSLATRVCFVLDPVRLQNLGEIASNRALSEEVRFLTLTVSSLYPSSPRDIQLAAGWGQYGHTIAQDKAAAVLMIDSNNDHPDPVDVSAVSAILRRLRATGKCQLHLDLTTHPVWASPDPAIDPFATPESMATTGEERGVFPYMPYHDDVYHDLLYAVAVDAQFEVQRITIDDNRMVDLVQYGEAAVQKLRESVRALQEVSIGVSTVILDHQHHHHHHHPDGDSDSHLNGGLRDPRYSHVQRLIVASADALQAFTLVSDPPSDNFCCDVSFRPDVINIASLLLIRPLRHLVKLRLRHISVPECLLLSMLRNCSGTLRHLQLTDITLDATSWRGLFIHLRRTCLALDHIDFQGLVTRQPDGSYVPVVFDVARRSSQIFHVHRPEGRAADIYFDDGVHADWREHHRLHLRGASEVRAALEGLCVGDQHLEPADTCLSQLAVESYELWRRNGRGSPDCFGIQALAELCAGCVAL